MSGDVQPRKRKDKRRKKDELSLDELRGTSAVFGEGDVFMHSYHEHGTGGHWCAKIIFFSLLAILITLIGLIILENRGLSELEANSVESRYSGVLEGWLEDAPEDDHHDEHTLDLKHHDIKRAINRPEDHDDNALSDEEDQTEDEEASDEKKDEDERGLESGEDNINSVEDDIEEDIDQSYNEDEDVPYSFRKYFGAEEDSDENEQDNDDIEQDNDDIQQDDDIQKDDDEDDDIQKEDEDDDDIQKNDDGDDIRQDDDSHGDDDDDDIQDNDEDSDEIIKSDIDENTQEDSNEIDSSEVDDVEEKYFKNAKYNEDDDDEDDQKEEPKYSRIGDEDYDSENLQENSRSQEHEHSTEILTEYDDSNENQFSQFQEDDNHSEEPKEDANEHANDDEDDEPDLEVEKIEKEVIENPVFTELPALPEEDDDDNAFGISRENGVDDDEEEIEFLEPGDDDEPSIIEPVTAPAGKPFVEVDEDSSTVRPPGPDSLTEEEEYEKRQEELRREEEQASQMWLKLIVGGALLLATHAVLRRATVSPDVPKEQVSRKECTSSTERYMSRISEEPSTPVVSEVSDPEPPLQMRNETFKRIPFITKSVPTPKQTSEEDDNYEQDVKETEESVQELEDKELYSDDEEVEEEDVAEEKKEAENEPADVETEEDMGDEVEIIDHEQLEEEEEEESVEEDEEDISDVDDAELLSRLEAKYGRLPEPERPGQKYKDGGQSMDETWPGEPADAYWRTELNKAEDEFNQGAWRACVRRLEAGGAALRDSARARWLTARALDAEAEALRDNKALTAAINAYMHLLKMGDRLSDKRLLEITERTLDRIQFRGTYLSAEPIYRMLMRRFPDEPKYPNKLVVAFLMANRQDLAEDLLNETLKRWPNDRFALAHLGFVLKTRHNKLEAAVEAFLKALEGDSGPANDPRFYYHLGDALMLLGRNDEAHEVHKRGAALGHFLSASQRSLYNVARLKSQPWWDIEKTPYVKLARALEKSWRQILEEGRTAKALYEQEKEGLKERGDWSQMDLFVRGQEVPHRCKLAPVTCAIVRAEPAAAGCRRGQVKFSAMQAGTHVRAHVGPTNCRLRMHLGLSNTKDTFIRVDKEIRQWREGKVLMFDDSFEHEVWHNGTGARLVLIVDVWHPGLTPAERRSLPAI